MWGFLKWNLKWEIAEISFGEPADGVKMIPMQQNVPNEAGKQLMENEMWAFAFVAFVAESVRLFQHNFPTRRASP